MIHLMYDGNWTCEYVSDEYCLHMKIGREEINDFLNKLNNGEPITNKGAVKLTDAMKKSLAQAGKAEFEWTTKDGSVIQHNTEAVHLEDGIVRIYGKITDITQQRTQEEKLRLREKENSLILQHTGKMIYRYIIETKTAVFSESIVERFNVPEIIEDFPQWNITQGGVSPKNTDIWFDLFDAIHRGERKGSAQILFVKANNEEYRCKITFDTLTDSKGKPVSAVLSFEDVSMEYQRMRQQKLENEALIASTQSLFSEVILMNLTKNEYNILYTNDTAVWDKIKTGTIDRMINLRIPMIAVEDRIGFVGVFSRRSLLKAFEEDGKNSVETIYRRLSNTNDEHWFETTAIYLENPFDDNTMAVIVSQNVDKEKAEELRLKSELQLRSEEIRMTMSQIGKVVCYYDVLRDTLVIPESAAAEKHIPMQITNFPNEIADYESGKYTLKAKQTIRKFYSDIKKGRKIGQCEVCFVENDGKERWERLEFGNIFDESGDPTKAVVIVEDITQLHESDKEHSYLKTQERLLRSVADHSQRTICYYNIQKSRSEHWSEENCANCIMPKLCESSLYDIATSADLMPETSDIMMRILDEMGTGSAEGEEMLHVIDNEGKLRWLNFKYSSYKSDNGKPEGVLFSYADITEQYEKDLAYEHYSRIIDGDEASMLLVEDDLTTGIIEQKHGKLAEYEHIKECCTYDQFRAILQNACCDREEFINISRIISREYMLEQYEEGVSHFEFNMQINSVIEDVHWIKVRIDLAADPYSHHIKGFYRIVDITSKMEEEILMHKRATIDSMTGLLNRDTVEDRILETIEEHRSSVGGIMIVVDIDDLKAINDNFSYEEGDRAICEVAEILKAHFHHNEIMGRFTGGEFVVFIKAVADKKDNVGMSLRTLLRKLSYVTLGPDDEELLSCSIGCAEELPGSDNFETLHKKAYAALSYVKEAGRKSFDFYSEEKHYNYMR